LLGSEGARRVNLFPQPIDALTMTLAERVLLTVNGILLLYYAI
jgi:hypothetical protein